MGSKSDYALSVDAVHRAVVFAKYSAKSRHNTAVARSVPDHLTSEDIGTTTSEGCRT